MFILSRIDRMGVINLCTCMYTCTLPQKKWCVYTCTRTLYILYSHTLLVVCACACACRQSLSLTRALLHLSEQMHYFEVMSLLVTPLKHCPEVLFISIIESTVSY